MIENEVDVPVTAGSAMELGIYTFGDITPDPNTDRAWAHGAHVYDQMGTACQIEQQRAQGTRSDLRGPRLVLPPSC